MDVIMNKKLIELKKQERNKIRQQERLLINIAKEYKKLLEASGKTEDELKQFLGKNDAFIAGVKHGFGNIRIRELADIFTFFNKEMLVSSIEIGEKVQVILMGDEIPSWNIERPSSISRDIKKMFLFGTNNKSELKGSAMVCFDENNDILETSDALEHAMKSTCHTLFKYNKMGLENGR